MIVCGASKNGYDQAWGGVGPTIGFCPALFVLSSVEYLIDPSACDAGYAHDRCYGYARVVRLPYGLVAPGDRVASGLLGSLCGVTGGLQVGYRGSHIRFLPSCIEVVSGACAPDYFCLLLDFLAEEVTAQGEAERVEEFRGVVFVEVPVAVIAPSLDAVCHRVF